MRCTLDSKNNIEISLPFIKGYVFFVLPHLYAYPTTVKAEQILFSYIHTVFGFKIIILFDV